MEDDHENQSFGSGFSHAQPPPIVSLIPFSPSISPSPRRLSSHFSESTRPVRSARRLSWVSLQGRLVGAEEASSAKTIGGSLSREEAVSWELFSPIHRILIVAVVAVATADLKKSRQIWKLQRSVDLRDQVLLSMQQKLDDLCEQVNTMKDGTETEAEVVNLFTKYKDFPSNNDRKSNETKFSSCGCHRCDLHSVQSNGSLGDSVEKSSDGDEMFKFKMPLVVGAEQEERRMSDLSDWASSVTSSADIQLSSLAVEQDIYNLQRECEEKDATIKELAAVVHASDVAGSKRTAELEDIIRRKNMIITKLKKDMLVLEAKVVHLTRLRRPSSSASTLNTTKQLPVMADNLIYDMESSTSPSSSDSDCDLKHNRQVLVTHSNVARRSHRAALAKEANNPISLPRLAEKPPKPRHVSPLKENSMNQSPELVVTLKPKQCISAEGDLKWNRRSVQRESKATTPLKRWV